MHPIFYLHICTAFLFFSLLLSLLLLWLNILFTRCEAWICNESTKVCIIFFSFLSTFLFDENMDLEYTFFFVCMERKLLKVHLHFDVLMSVQVFAKLIFDFVNKSIINLTIFEKLKFINTQTYLIYVII